MGQYFFTSTQKNEDEELESQPSKRKNCLDDTTIILKKHKNERIEQDDFITTQSNLQDHFRQTPQKAKELIQGLVTHDFNTNIMNQPPYTSSYNNQKQHNSSHAQFDTSLSPFFSTNGFFATQNTYPNTQTRRSNHNRGFPYNPSPEKSAYAHAYYFGSPSPHSPFDSNIPPYKPKNSHHRSSFSLNHQNPSLDSNSQNHSTFNSNSQNQSIFNSNSQNHSTFNSNSQNQSTFNSNSQNQSTFNSNSQNQSTFGSVHYPQDQPFHPNDFHQASSHPFHSQVKRHFFKKTCTSATEKKEPKRV